MEQLTDDFSRSFDYLLTYVFRQRRRYIVQSLGETYHLNGVTKSFIIFLDQHPGSSQDMLCSTFYIEKCTVSKRIKQMEQEGYIRRETDERDRRQNKLFLTEEGKKLVPIINSCMDEWNRAIIEGISREDQKALLSALERMCTNCKDE